MSKEKIIKDIKDFYNISKKGLIASGIYSILVAITIMFQTKITFSGICQKKYRTNHYGNFYWTDIISVIIYAILAFIVVINIVALCNKRKILKKKPEKSYKINIILYWLIATLLLSIPYLIYFSTYFPGFIHGDSFNSIFQGMNLGTLVNHHPILYSCFVGIFMRIGVNLFSSYNMGVGLYTFTQMFIIVGGLAYFLTWLKKHNVKTIFIILAFLFFAINTYNLAIGITMWKDGFFSLFIFIMALYIYDIVEQNGQQLRTPGGILKFILLDFLIAFIRNNGIYVLLAETIILLIYFRTRFKVFKTLQVISIIIIILIQGPGYRYLGIVSPAEEKYGMQIQQIASVIVYNGNITDEQKEFINKLKPLESWRKSYAPCTVDTTKWSGDFNSSFLQNNQKEFLKVWFELLLNNKTLYLKAYLMETFGFWAFGVTKGNDDGTPGYMFPDNDNGIGRIDLIKEKTGVTLEEIYQEIPSSISPGTLVWIMFLVVVLLIAQGHSKYILTLTPVILTWLSIMISAPIAICIRYVYVLVYALPWMLMLPFLIQDDKLTNKEKYAKEVKKINKGHKNEI